MSEAVQPLTVPAPELDPPAGPAELEKPVNVLLPPVLYPDASEMTQEDIRKFGAFVYRNGPGGDEIWDEKSKVWTVAPYDDAALADMSPLPFTPAEEGASAPWKAILVAIGQKDKEGAPRFVKADGGAPVYRVRAFALAQRNGVTFRGLGAPSPDLQFISATENQRFTIELDTETPRDAGRARLVLKNAALQPAAYLELRAAGGHEVEIANTTPSGAVLARITLSAGGDIRLTPAAGREIILEGPLRAQRITYEPSGGGGTVTL